ncbi:MAG TPA: sulfite exporter TauE/SafE family protein [Candidatus Limnocylindrales bacterium]|nr:sulfite exporter TauE/SafE family protein [Candidatus Limnocylindrales bacterium]
MSSSEIILLFSAAVLGGAVNSVAGGGGFIAFPALLFTGMPSINANATNTVALWPGTLASTGAYRKALNGGLLKRILPLIIITFLGSVVGSVLLLRTRVSTFDKMVPWLLLGATVLFSFGGKITRWITGHHTEGGPSRMRVLGVTLLQACVAVYIGYFGAGVGIVMLALLAIMGMENIHSMNGLKTLLATCGNAMAVVIFIFAHAVYWPQALLMVVGAALGGYMGAWYAQKLDPRRVRYIVIAIGYSMTCYFFWRVYIHGRV